MKLRNKKTGEIYDFKIMPDYGDVMSGWKIENKDFGIRYYSDLAELNAEWEDYKEPKDFYVVEQRGIVSSRFSTDDEYVKKFKEIGNYFKTREEAEEAIKKLKAWKRLKDKGFRFDCYMRRSDWAELSEVVALENLIDITAYLPKDKIKEMEADLDLLFGGDDNDDDDDMPTNAEKNDLTDMGYGG